MQKRRALRVDADPAAVDALENVGEDALLVHLGGIDLVVQGVSAVGHGDIASIRT